MCSIWRGLLLLRAFLLLPFRHCAKCTQFRVRTHFNPIAAKMRTTHPKYTRITSNACANCVAAKRKVNWYFVVGDHKCKWRDLPKDSHFYVRLWARRSLSIFFFFYLVFLCVSVVHVLGIPIAAPKPMMDAWSWHAPSNGFSFFVSFRLS